MLNVPLLLPSLFPFSHHYYYPSSFHFPPIVGNVLFALCSSLAGRSLVISCLVPCQFADNRCLCVKCAMCSSILRFHFRVAPFRPVTRNSHSDHNTVCKRASVNIHTKNPATKFPCIISQSSSSFSLASFHFSPVQIFCRWSRIYKMFLCSLVCVSRCPERVCPRSLNP